MSRARSRVIAPGMPRQARSPLFGGRTVLLIDEAWHLIGRAETGSYANDLARRARHLGLFFIVMSQHLSDFETDHGLALLRNSTMQLLFAQHPDEISFVQDALRLSDQEAAVIAQLKTVKGSYSQALWVNGTRGRGRVALRLGPTEYWAYTSDPADVPLRNAAIAAHGDEAWAASSRSPGAEPGRIATGKGATNRWKTAAESGPTTSAARWPASFRRSESGRGEQRRAGGRTTRLRTLLAVCGLVGGAGTTTLAYLIAAAAAWQWDHSVLVAGCWRLERRAGRTLPESSPLARCPSWRRRFALGVPLDGLLYATTRDGLRVLARGPDFGTSAPLSPPEDAPWRRAGGATR